MQRNHTFPIYRSLKAGTAGWEQIFRSPVLAENLGVLSTRDFSLWDVQSIVEYYSIPGKYFDPSKMECVPPFQDIFLEWTDVQDGAHYGCAITQEDDEWWITPFYLQKDARIGVMSPVYERWKFKEGVLAPYLIDGVETRGPRVVVGGVGNPDHPELKFWDAWVRMGGNIALLSFMFSHCKNVDLVERLPKRHEQREAKRKGEPILKYHEIVIDPNRTYANSETVKSSANKPTRALHLVRGHFAYYSEEKPLFGKYSGLFWIPAHVRGNAEFGEVKSTYKVKPLKDDAA